MVVRRFRLSLFADKAYASDTRKKRFRKAGIYYGILDRGRRNQNLSSKQKKNNGQKSKIRNAVERPFAHKKRIYGFVRVGYVRLARNRVQFIFLCIIHNIRRGIAFSGMQGIG